jgi:putative DNA methylase
MDTLMPLTGPRLIEHGFPCHQVGAETQREQDVGKQPPTHRLHVWWARRPLTASRAAILASLSLPSLPPDEFLRKLGIERRVVDLGGEEWVIAGKLLDRVRQNHDGAVVLPVDAVVLRYFENEQRRRVANLKLGADLEERDPTLAGDPILQRWKAECRPLPGQWVRLGEELSVATRPGDPDFANARIEFEKAQGIRTAEDAYGYDRAFAAAPVLTAQPGVILDPTAGGGSIPFEALRLGYRAVANELNPVATVILYATLDYPVRFGRALVAEIRDFGDRLVGRVHNQISEFFPCSPISTDERVRLARALSKHPELVERYLEERIDDFLFCRQVTCPTCAGEAPLLNSCWLVKGDEPWAVRVITDGRKRGGKVRFETYRVVGGRGPHGEDPDLATVNNAVGTCIHCHQSISGEDIEDQANGRSEHGRWSDRLYCIAAVRFEPKLDENGHPERYKSGERKGEIKTRKVRFFRAPNDYDFEALVSAERRLAEKWPEWDRAGLIPTEAIPQNINDPRPIRYGMPRWCDLFTSRQLYGHLTLVEELRQLTPEIIGTLGKERGRAVVTYLQFVIDKAVDYNSKQTRWHYTRGVIVGSFGRHDFSLKWTFAEMCFAGASSGIWWALNELLDAYSAVLPNS